MSEDVKRQIRNEAIFDIGALAVLLLLYYLAHYLVPEKIPFSFSVILGGLGGTLVVILIAVWRARSVLKARDAEGLSEEETRKAVMREYQTSVFRRKMLQLLWMVICVVSPFLNLVTGIVPLLFPGMYVRGLGVLSYVNPGLYSKVMGDPNKD